MCMTCPFYPHLLEQKFSSLLCPLSFLGFTRVCVIVGRLSPPNLFCSLLTHAGTQPSWNNLKMKAKKSSKTLLFAYLSTCPKVVFPSLHIVRKCCHGWALLSPLVRRLCECTKRAYTQNIYTHTHTHTHSTTKCKPNADWPNWNKDAWGTEIQCCQYRKKNPIIFRGIFEVFGVILKLLFS
jgi:hypothetical protein